MNNNWLRHVGLSFHLSPVCVIVTMPCWQEAPAPHTVGYNEAGFCVVCSLWLLWTVNVPESCSESSVFRRKIITFTNTGWNVANCFGHDCSLKHFRRRTDQACYSKAVRLVILSSNTGDGAEGGKVCFEYSSTVQMTQLWCLWYIWGKNECDRMVRVGLCSCTSSHSCWLDHVAVYKYARTFKHIYESMGICLCSVGRCVLIILLLGWNTVISDFSHNSTWTVMLLKSLGRIQRLGGFYYLKLSLFVLMINYLLTQK